MAQVAEFLHLPPGVVIAIGILLLALILSAFLYIVPKFVLSKPLPVRLEYLFYSFLVPLLPLMDLMRPPWWRRKWLQRSDVREGMVVLEEGIGFGTSPIIAARMVGPRGKVYALDVMPLHVAILWVRAKLRRLRNLHIILSDAKYTGLPDRSVDVVFTCDAFHEFPDKLGTLRELSRVLKEDGILAVWDETAKKAENVVRLANEAGLFSLVEQDGKFCKFRKVKSETSHETGGQTN